MSENLLQVKNLKTYFFTDGGVVKSVDDVSFNVKPGKTLGVVGESGCGKSITSLSIMQLLRHLRERLLTVRLSIMVRIFSIRIRMKCVRFVAVRSP